MGRSRSLTSSRDSDLLLRAFFGTGELCEFFEEDTESADHSRIWSSTEFFNVQGTGVGAWNEWCSLC
ncbi:hypothetical protein [Rubritalea tangerina]|uniref:hypothetical protein n=1 Tax=Rubritalea tangerina TaxID=430798 RepID=UPI0036130D82